jgi:hypothetical protein
MGVTNHYADIGPETLGIDHTNLKQVSVCYSKDSFTKLPWRQTVFSAYFTQVIHSKISLSGNTVNFFTESVHKALDKPELITG